MTTAPSSRATPHICFWAANWSQSLPRIVPQKQDAFSEWGGKCQNGPAHRHLSSQRGHFPPAHTDLTSYGDSSLQERFFFLLEQKKPSTAAAMLHIFGWWAPSDRGSWSTPTSAIWNWILPELTVIKCLFPHCLIYYPGSPLNLTEMLLIDHPRPPAPLRLHHSAWLSSSSSCLKGIQKKI